MENLSNSSFSTNLNKNYLTLLEKLRTMKTNYLKAKMDMSCSNEFNLFLIWVRYLSKQDVNNYLKIINGLSGEKVINKKTIRHLNEEDVLDQNPFKLDDILWMYFKFHSDFISSFEQHDNKEEYLMYILKLLSNNSSCVLSVFNFINNSFV